MSDVDGVLTAEQKNYFRHYDEMFATQGWTIFKEQMAHEVESINEQIKYHLTPETIPAARARRDMAAEVMRLEELIEQQKDMIVQNAQMGEDRE